jgi:hypothetical protein
VTGTEASRLPVAIVGAGFSGTLLAINLMRLGVNVVLVERDERQLGKGLAFGTRQPEHLLNVRAANMSAFPDDPGHFLRWMGFSDGEGANRFVPRLAYGHYLRELLVAALAADPDRAQIVQAEAIEARFDPDGIALSLKEGRAIACRALVLALGNFPPSPLPQLVDLPSGLQYPDPWAPGAMDDVVALDHIVLMGSGLTAADVIVSLNSAGFKGRITALSRRGLKPRAHAEVGPSVQPPSRPDTKGSWLVRAVRTLGRSRLARRDRRASAPHPASLASTRRGRTTPLPAPPATLLGRSPPPIGAASVAPTARVRGCRPATLRGRQGRGCRGGRWPCENPLAAAPRRFGRDDGRRSRHHLHWPGRRADPGGSSFAARSGRTRQAAV